MNNFLVLGEGCDGVDYKAQVIFGPEHHGDIDDVGAVISDNHIETKTLSSLWLSVLVNRDSQSISIDKVDLMQAIKDRQKDLANETGERVSGARALSSLINTLEIDIRNALEQFHDDASGLPGIHPD